MSRSKHSPLIYLDHASATPIDSAVKKEIVETLELYGNPSSFNNIGRAARDKLDQSRIIIAKYLNARLDEVIITSSGSESNSLAILGLAKIFNRPVEIITSPIEHLSVLESLKSIQREGWKITYVKVNREGIVDLDDLRSKLNPKVALISIMYANNEIGTIQPIKSIAKIIRNFRNQKQGARSRKQEANEKFPIFHSDACQATEYLDMNVNNLGVDMMTLNGSKIYGPKGVAVLYKRRGTLLNPIIYGGDQEQGLRAGTENLSAIAGLAKALSIIDRKKESERVTSLRDYFLKKLGEEITGIRVNGPFGEKRLPNNVNVSFSDLMAENILLELDKRGIYASSGSACTARSNKPSHVIRAIRIGKSYERGTIRFSLGRETTKEDIDYVVYALLEITKVLAKRNYNFSKNND